MAFIPFQDRLKLKIDSIYEQLESNRDLRDIFPEDEQLRNFIVLKLAQNNLLLYTMLTHGRYKITWAHELLCKKLESVEAGECKRLIVIAPPRFGKSWLSSVTFPTYYLAKNDHQKVMAVSYNASLVSDFGNHARNITQSEAYFDIWAVGLDNPDLKDLPILSRDRKAVTRFGLNNGSEYIGQGLGGGVTGKGGNVILIDDWIKNHKDLNGGKLDSDWEYFSSTLYNRQEDSETKGDAAFVVIQTHWHKRDLIGRLKDEMNNGGEKWEIFHIKAEATKNEFYSKNDFYYYH